MAVELEVEQKGCSARELTQREPTGRKLSQHDKSFHSDSNILQAPRSHSIVHL